MSDNSISYSKLTLFLGVQEKLFNVKTKNVPNNEIFKVRLF